MNNIFKQHWMPEKHHALLEWESRIQSCMPSMDQVNMHTHTYKKIPKY